MLKVYPHREMSTIVRCNKCGGENKINEVMAEEDSSTYYHLNCVSDGDTDKAAETVKVHELTIHDDLSVKSEGR